MAQTVQKMATMWKTWVWSLSREDPLEKEMATHSSILAWRIPWTEEPGGLYSPWDCKESDTTEWLTVSDSVPPRKPIAHGTLLNVMWQAGWERSVGENGYKYMHGWVPFLSTGNYHNIVISYIPIQSKKLKKKKNAFARQSNPVLFELCCMWDPFIV